MLDWLKTRSGRRQIARSLYGSIVARSREPLFYARLGVPDTLQGRFEMVALHLVLALRRLAAEGREGERLSRALTEAFVVDLDDVMREMTFGDLAVPREVKRAAAALFDRHRAYQAALDAPGDAPLADALRAQLSYLYAGEGTQAAGKAAGGLPHAGGAALDAPGLSHYVRSVASALDAQPSPTILAGRLEWPQIAP
jgi:cytochrome b pre-mRNA-processing protein 3